MRSLLFISTLIISLFLTAGAQTVEFSEGGTKATAITGLNVNGTDFDVEFSRLAPVGVYGTYPGTFTFTTDTDAENAASAINTALTNAGALTVGPAGQSDATIYVIGFEGYTPPGPVGIEQCKIARARFKSDSTGWENLRTDFTFYNSDPRLFAVFTEISGSQPEPPTISDISDQTTNEDTPTPAIDFTISDPDTDPADLTVSGSSDNESLIPNNAIIFGGAGTDRTVTISPAANQSGSATITITVSDGELNTNDTFLLEVTSQNDSPTLANPIPSRLATQDTQFSYQFPENTFSDIDGEELTYTATLPDNGPLPTWLGFTAETRTFSGTPAQIDTGIVAVKVTATDGASASVSDEFFIYVRNLNDPPVLENTISDQEVDEDSPYEYQFAENTFSDGDGDELYYSATLTDNDPLPTWLGFNPETRTFSGTPLNEDVGSMVVKVTATDPADESVSDEFSLTVINTNDAPETANEIPDQQATEDIAYSYQFAENTFRDVDGDELTYSATLSDNDPLPDWLGFTPGTRTFIGTPLNEDVGTIVVKVTATDLADESVSDEFSLTVVMQNDPPVISEIDPQSFNEDDSLTYEVLELLTFIEDPDQPDSLLTLGIFVGSHVRVELQEDFQLVFSAPAQWNGLDTIVVTASDGQLADTAAIYFEVKPVNDAPFFVDVPDTVVMYQMEEKILDLSPYADDHDLGMPTDSLRWQIGVDDESLQYEFDSETQNLTLTAPNADGIFTVTMTVTDDSAATADESFYVKVTQDPTSVEKFAAGIPNSYSLEQNYPNPFNPNTQIKFGLPKAGDVLVEVYNLLGQKIVTLFKGYKAAGYHIIDFRAKNLPTGLYFYQIKANNFQEVKKMMLMK